MFVKCIVHWILKLLTSFLMSVFTVKYFKVLWGHHWSHSLLYFCIYYTASQVSSLDHIPPYLDSENLMCVVMVKGIGLLEYSLLISCIKLYANNPVIGEGYVIQKKSIDLDCNIYIARMCISCKSDEEYDNTELTGQSAFSFVLAITETANQSCAKATIPILWMPQHAPWYTLTLTVIHSVISCLLF